MFNKEYLKVKQIFYNGKINAIVCNNKITKKMLSVYLFVSNFDQFCFRACNNYHPIVFLEECKHVAKKKMPECFTEEIYISCNKK